MLITNTGRVLWWYQMSHRNKVIIKVDLGTLKVLVEAHRSRVGFVYPDDRKIFSGPSRWYCIDTACKHVTRSRECIIMEWVKKLVENKIELGMVDTKWSDLGQVIISWDKRNWLYSLLIHTITSSSSSKWVIMDFQIPLMIIDRRGVLIMSTLFTNHRVTHLRFADAFWVHLELRLNYWTSQGLFQKSTKTISGYQNDSRR
jgi:hypothetical protein